MVFRQSGIDDFLTADLQGRNGAFLIGTHEAAVTNNIRGNYGCQSSSRLRHSLFPFNRDNLREGKWYRNVVGRLARHQIIGPSSVMVSAFQGSIIFFAISQVPSTLIIVSR